MENRSSSCNARTIWMSFAPTVRGRGSSSRAACMVSVDPPDTTCPARTNCAAARASEIGSMPGCHQNRRSSVRTSRSMNSGETSSTVVRNRHTPPFAGSSASVRPLRSTTSLPTLRRRDRSGGYIRSSVRRARSDQERERDDAGGQPFHCAGSTVIRFAACRAYTPGRYMSDSSAPGIS